MKMVRTFISYYKPHWKLFAVDMLCAFLVACCDLVYPMIAKDIINVYVPDRNLRLVIVWAVAMLAIYVAKCLLNFVVQYWGHIVGVRMQGDMRRDMFRHLQKLPFSFFDENKTGTLMSRMINDLQEVSELAHHGPENIFLAAVMLVGSFVLLAGIDVWLAVIAFSLVPVMLLFSWRARRMMRDAFAKARVETGEVNANVETAIAGMPIPPPTMRWKSS